MDSNSWCPDKVNSATLKHFLIKSAFFHTSQSPFYWAQNNQRHYLVWMDCAQSRLCSKVKTRRGTIPANKYSTRESVRTLTLIKPLNILENQVNQIHTNMMYLSRDMQTLARFLTCTLWIKELYKTTFGRVHHRKSLHQVKDSGETELLFRSQHCWWIFYNSSFDDHSSFDILVCSI